MNPVDDRHVPLVPITVETGQDLLKLGPRRNEVAHAPSFVVARLEQTNSKKPFKENIGELGIHLHLLALNRQTISLVIQLVAQPMIPFDLANVDTNDSI